MAAGTVLIVLGLISVVSSQGNSMISRRSLTERKTSTRDFGIYHISEQQRLRLACLYAQSRQGHSNLRTQSMDVERETQTKLRPLCWAFKGV